MDMKLIIDRNGTKTKTRMVIEDGDKEVHYLSVAMHIFKLLLLLFTENGGRHSFHYGHVEGPASLLCKAWKRSSRLNLFKGKKMWTNLLCYMLLISYYCHGSKLKLKIRAALRSQYILFGSQKSVLQHTRCSGLSALGCSKLKCCSLD